MSGSLVTGADLERAAQALWDSRNDIDWRELPDDEREAAWANTLTDAEAVLDATGLLKALDEYGDHQSWRCGHPDRYPWEPDCPCGLVSTLERFGLNPRPNGSDST